MDRIRPHILFVAVIAFALIVAAIFLFRANPPTGLRTKKETRKEFTYGNFITGPLRVPKNELLAFKFELNRKARLKGKFVTEGFKSRLTVVVVLAEGLEKMRSGFEVSPITTTGEVPGGVVSRSFEPGTYYVVFDNRNGSEDVLVQEADFSLE